MNSGTALAAAGSIVTTVMGMFQGAPTDVQIIRGLIEDQTAQIESMIDNQTEILLNALEEVKKNQKDLAKWSVRQILLDNYHQGSCQSENDCFL